MSASQSEVIRSVEHKKFSVNFRDQYLGHSVVVTPSSSNIAGINGRGTWCRTNHTTQEAKTCIFMHGAHNTMVRILKEGKSYLTRLSNIVPNQVYYGIMEGEGPSMPTVCNREECKFPDCMFVHLVEPELVTEVREVAGGHSKMEVAWYVEPNKASMRNEVIYANRRSDVPLINFLRDRSQGMAIGEKKLIDLSPADAGIFAAAGGDTLRIEMISIEYGGRQEQEGSETERDGRPSRGGYRGRGGRGGQHTSTGSEEAPRERYQGQGRGGYRGGRAGPRTGSFVPVTDTQES